MNMSQTTRNKALEINKDINFYGSFAEIGAGQEVARHFFQAGLSSQTVAKSMSAYDKAFSDSIYGKGTRFVSQERLMNMLSHEFELMDQRLPDRKNNTCFFAFANTVATSSHEEIPTCHGWMGIRFQKRPNGPVNDILIHVKMRDRLRLQQQEALGALGVNLVYAAYKHADKGGADLISSLIDHLGNDRIEINFIRFSGPDVEHFDNRLMSLELVRQDITRVVLFSPKGEPLSAGDVLYKKPILIQRGRFRPVTATNEKILLNGIEQMVKDQDTKKESIVPIMELTMSQLATDGQLDKKDFLDRVDTITALGHHVMISNFPLFAQLHCELRRMTDQPIGIVLGATTLEGLFDRKFYANYSGGILSSFGQLNDGKTKFYVYPYRTDQACTTAGTFKPKDNLGDFYSYLRTSQFIVDMHNCDDVDTGLHSDAVRKLLSAGNPKWEDLVPAPVRKIIKDRKLFGYPG